MEVFKKLYESLLLFFGTIDNQPAWVNDLTILLSWLICASFIALIYLLILLSGKMILTAIQGKKKNQVHYYYHRGGDE